MFHQNSFQKIKKLQLHNFNPSVGLFFESQYIESSVLDQNVESLSGLTQSLKLIITFLVTGVSPTQNKMEPDNRRLQIEATLRTLNENVPFRVRFKREPSVRGRVYGFECSTQRPSTELKVFIEYPIGKFFHLMLLRISKSLF